MSPQFVDFNADGHTDIVAGGFNGTPMIAYGSKDGFAQPTFFVDDKGERIIGNMFWRYGDKAQWVYLNQEDKNQLTSAFAFDIDADGDHDLILGDYAGGRVFVRTNSGTNAKPVFAGANEPFKVAGEALDYEDKLATMRMVDWDGDGKLDLMTGTFGYSGKAQVNWYKNVGEGKANAFAAGKTLLSANEAKSGVLNGSHKAFYFDAVDYDRDGDLDLLVGGKAKDIPQMRELSDDEKKHLAKLKEERDANSKKLIAIYDKAREAAGERDAEWSKRYRAEIAKHEKELAPMQELSRKLYTEILKLEPRAMEKNRVWLYRNNGARTPEKVAKE